MSLRLAALGALAALACACGSPCGAASGVVEEVVDGDTIVLESGEKIRYLLVDTPEITNGKNDCYGTQARDFNRSLVLGKTVSLRFDQECGDRFGRKLAYVTVDGQEVNRALVEQGYACVLAIPPNGVDRETEFRDLASVARTERRGLWGACATVTCGN